MTEAHRRTNPHRLFRDPGNGMLAGVCAGLADYFGFNLKGLRVLAAIGAVIFAPFVITSYVILAILLPKRPVEERPDKAREDFWRSVSNAPSDTFSSVRHRFRELDLRLQRMEAFVTSKEFEIDRELGRHGGRDR